MRIAPLLAAALALSACVAETVERRRPRRGPVKEVGYVDPGGGRVRYSTEGWSWFVAGRRRHARRLMRRNCGRDLRPEILDEYTREDADAAYSGDDVDDSLGRGLEHYKIAPYHHYYYECRPKDAAPAKPAAPPAPAPLPAPAISTATAAPESP